MSKKRKHTDINSNNPTNDDSNNKRNRHTNDNIPPMKPPPILRLMFGIPPYSLQDRFNEEHNPGNNDQEDKEYNKKKENNDYDNKNIEE